MMLLPGKFLKRLSIKETLSLITLNYNLISKWISLNINMAARTVIMEIQSNVCSTSMWFYSEGRVILSPVRSKNLYQAICLQDRF